jgi:hypothetical protein
LPEALESLCSSFDSADGVVTMQERLIDRWLPPRAYSYPEPPENKRRMSGKDVFYIVQRMCMREAERRTTNARHHPWVEMCFDLSFVIPDKDLRAFLAGKSNIQRSHYDRLVAHLSKDLNQPEPDLTLPPPPGAEKQEEPVTQSENESETEHQLKIVQEQLRLAQAEVARLHAIEREQQRQIKKHKEDVEIFRKLYKMERKKATKRKDKLRQLKAAPGTS